MIDYQVYDEFKDKLPKITFDKELALPLHTKKPPMWNNIAAKEDEIQIETLSVSFDFPDGEGLLLTSYNDFIAFMK